MLKKCSSLLLSLAIASICMSLSWAGDMATPDEAKAMNKKAISAIKKDRDKAFTAFQDANGPFQVKDLYVFCMDMKGVMLVHGKKPQLNGKNLYDFNKYGDLLFQDMIKVAKDQGSGWVDYKWPYPATDQVRDKTSYIETVDDFFCGVGAYK